MCSLDDPVLNERLVCMEVLTPLSAMLTGALTQFCCGRGRGVVEGAERGGMESGRSMGGAESTGSAEGAVGAMVGDGRRRVVGREDGEGKQVATLLCGGVTLLKLMR